MRWVHSVQRVEGTCSIEEDREGFVSSSTSVDSILMVTLPMLGVL
ncbi:MAG: hypothetical protein JWQ26_2399 [Modestobacter sp.]|jgi:hypothetical protein|nr:hypothetical protein [Modestobacter sp.]